MSRIENCIKIKKIIDRYNGLRSQTYIDNMIFNKDVIELYFRVREKRLMDYGFAIDIDELGTEMEELPFKIVTDNKYLFSVNVGVYDALLDITPTNKLKSLKGFPSKIKTLHIGKGCKYLESFGNDIEHINTLILQGGNFETFDGIPFTEKLIINNTILKEIKDFSMLTERVEFVHTGVVTYETEVFMKSIARKLS